MWLKEYFEISSMSPTHIRTKQSQRDSEVGSFIIWWWVPNFIRGTRDCASTTGGVPPHSKVLERRLSNLGFKRNKMVYGHAIELGASSIHL